MKTITKIIAALIISISIFSCNPDDIIITDGSVLNYSVDTLMFDTVFTTIGSATRFFTVTNNQDQAVTISSIKLAKGENSNFRINVNGTSGNASDIIIKGNDSIYIFVEVTVDPNRDEMLEQDSIVFETANNSDNIDLVAFGQDVILINDSVVNTQTWTSEKPYLIYNSMAVDENQILTLESGAHLYFHRGSALIVLGTIIANGSMEEPIVFEGDRLEHEYFDVPGQWDGIWLTKLSKNNYFNYAHIKNANIGIAADSVNGAGYFLSIHNSKLEHHSLYGIFTQMSSVFATNTVISDCGRNALMLTRGGYYEFIHCTIGNYWSNQVRTSPSVFINNHFSYDQTLYVYNLERAYFGNCIIWGNQDTEFNYDAYTDGVAFNFMVENSFVKIDTSAHINIENTEHFKSNFYKSNPLFLNTTAYDFSLDTISPAIDAGDINITQLYPELLNYDINGLYRLSNNKSDIGAYEFNLDK